jgi:TRAP-type C4-dicarboxylate transport system permease small subunit
MGKFEAYLVKGNQVLVALLLLAIFVIVFINVILRYGFGESLAWGEEVARFLMIAGTFTGSGLALREGRLVSIDFFQEQLPPSIRKLLRWALVLLMALLMGILTWLGIKFAMFGWNKETMATQIPRGIPYLAIPLGTTLFLMHLMFFARRFLTQEFEHDQELEPQDSEEEDK